MMKKKPEKMTKRRKKRRFALSRRRHSFVLVFGIFLFEFSHEHVTHTHRVY